MLTGIYPDNPYPPNAFAPSRPTNLSRRESPSSMIKDGRSPFSPSTRSATLPLTPPSPEARPQDGAFPIFPTTKLKSRSNTPTTVPEPSYSNHGGLQSQANSFGVFAPLSPKLRAREDVMKRLNALSPGPFDTNNNGDLRRSGHRRTGTSSSREDFIRAPNPGSSNGHSPQFSSASSYHTRKTSIVSSAGGPQQDRYAGNADMPTLVTKAGHSSTSVDSYDRRTHEDPSQSSRSRPNIGQLGRSQTSPAERNGLEGWQESSSLSHRIDPDPPQLKPPSHRPRPSVAAAIRPLDEIGSMSSFKSSRSLQGRKGSTPTANDNSEPQTSIGTEARSDQRLQDAPPVPRPTRALDFGIGNPYHLSTESASSNDSSGSDVRTWSSRSTPPLSDSPQRPKRRANTSKSGNSLTESPTELDNASALEQPASSRWASPPSFSRPLYSRPAETSFPRDLSTILPTSQSHPASRDDPPYSHVPAASPGDYMSPANPPASGDSLPPSRPPLASPDEHLAPEFPLQQGAIRRSPAPSPLPPPQGPLPRPRRTATNKGNCRGCGELIMGKSVSSADGRLTGRYHKSCFVCKTCTEPFQTTDFYVLNNHPYCGRHYHQLNDSLCKTCDRGIEGQYLETEMKQKFHPQCFTCQVSYNLPKCNLMIAVR